MSELLKNVESNIERHTMIELHRHGLLGSSDPHLAKIADNVLQLIRLLAQQGHSAESLTYVVELFMKLSHFMLLSPLTGDNSEWTLVSEDEPSGHIYQNKRCSRVFKDKDGPYDIEGRLLEKPNGERFWSSEYSIIKIKEFPYEPTTEIVKVDKNNKPIWPS